MQSDDVTLEQPLNLPAELLAELGRRNDRRQVDFRVDSLRPSLLERLARMLGFG